MSKGKDSEWRRVIARHNYPQLLKDTIYHYPTLINRKLAICGEEMNEFSSDTTKNVALRINHASLCETCLQLDPTTPTYTGV